MNKLKFIIKITIGLLLFSFSFIIFPLFKIRYGKLYSSRLGHTCFSIDNYLSNKKIMNNKNEIAIFCLEKKISNSEIVKIWKEQKGIFFSKIADYVLNFIYFSKIKSKIIIDWDEHNPIPTNLNLGEKNFKIDLNFLKKGEMLKNKLNIDSKKELICMVNRDELYLKNIINEKYVADKNFHDFKDFKFEDYEYAIKNFVSQDKIVLRIGNIVNDNYNFKNNNFVSLTNDNSTAFSDIYFLSQSKFCVHGRNGIQLVLAMFRKKSLCINFAPFIFDYLSQFVKGSMFISKKLFSKNKNRFLKFIEIENLFIEKNYDIHYQGDFFKDNNLEVVNNTPEEINKAILEFDKNFDNEPYEMKKNSMQEKFWKNFEHYKSYDLIVNKLKIRVPNSFLEENKNLI